MCVLGGKGEGGSSTPAGRYHVCVCARAFSHVAAPCPAEYKAPWDRGLPTYPSHAHMPHTCACLVPARPRAARCVAQANIDIDKTSNQAIIKGGAANVAAAAKMINDVLAREGSKTSGQLQVPKDMHRKIVGQGFQGVRDIQDLTNTRIEVPARPWSMLRVAMECCAAPECARAHTHTPGADPASFLRGSLTPHAVSCCVNPFACGVCQVPKRDDPSDILTIQGQVEGIEHAKRLILTKIAKFNSNSLHFPYGHYPLGGKGVIRLFLANKGAKLMEVTSTSKADINIDREKEEFIINGEESAYVRDAFTMISEILNTYGKVHEFKVADARLVSRLRQLPSAATGLTPGFGRASLAAAGRCCAPLLRELVQWWKTMPPPPPPPPRSGGGRGGGGGGGGETPPPPPPPPLAVTGGAEWRV